MEATLPQSTTGFTVKKFFQDNAAIFAIAILLNVVVYQSLTMGSLKNELHVAKHALSLKSKAYESLAIEQRSEYAGIGVRTSTFSKKVDGSCLTSVRTYQKSPGGDYSEETSTVNSTLTPGECPR